MCKEDVRLLKDVKEKLRYDPMTGHVYWINRGKRAGTVNGRGYRQINYNGRIWYEHRLIWYILYGRLPNEIDHINGDKKDNRVVNIRECTRGQNLWNTRGKKNALIPFKGVSVDGNKYAARIMRNGKNMWLGSYDTAEAAAVAYARASSAMSQGFGRI